MKDKENKYKSNSLRLSIQLLYETFSDIINSIQNISA